MSTPEKLVVLVTGASGGFGLVLSKIFLEHGYHVLAASRSITSPSMLELKSLGATLLKLDPGSSFENIKEVITKHAIPAYGKVDIVVNNAGFLIEGATEEFSPEDLEANYRTNVFGPIYISNALLPSMRARRSGLILHISSTAAHLTHSGAGVYSSTKAALSMLSFGQQLELAPLNIEVASIEPGLFRTAFLSHTGADIKNHIADYDGIVDRTGMKNISGKQNGDPVKGSRVIVEDVVGKWVKSGCKAGSLGTLRIPLGSDATGYITERAQALIEDTKVWKGIVDTTDY